MSDPILKVGVRGDLLAQLPRLTSNAAMADELKREMDEQDQYTVGHIMTRYLSFPATGPTTPDGLRAITNRLRGNLSAVPAQITPGGGVAGGVTNNVKYARYHELGADIPAHDIVARTAKALRFVIGGKVIFRKKVHSPGFKLSARAPMQRGIQDRISDYVTAFEDAIQRLLKN